VLLVTESAKADPSEYRQDVALHVALVTAVGAGGELQRSWEAIGP
jgi:hypothetical protein